MGQWDDQHRRKLPLSIDGLSRVNTERLCSTTKIRDRLHCRAFIHSASMLVLINSRLWLRRLKRELIIRLRIDGNVVESLLYNDRFTASCVKLVKLLLNRVTIRPEQDVGVIDYIVTLRDCGYYKIRYDRFSSCKQFHEIFWSIFHVTSSKISRKRPL